MSGPCVPRRVTKVTCPESKLCFPPLADVIYLFLWNYPGGARHEAGF